MDDLDRWAREAGERVRARAHSLANSDAGRVESHSRATREQSRPRGVLVAAGVLLVAGVGGLVLGVARQPASIDVASPASDPGNSVEQPALPTTVGDSAPATAQSTAPTSTNDRIAGTAAPTTPTSTAPSQSQPLVRPVVVNDRCDVLSALDGGLESLPLYQQSLPLSPFSRPSESEISIQVLGDADKSIAGPFVVVEHAEFSTAVSGDEAVIVNSWEVWLRSMPGGDLEAEWEIGDGTQGYAKARGLEQDEFVAVVASLTPRAGDASVLGFDYANDGVEAVDLLHEAINTQITGNGSGSSCRDADTGEVFRVWAPSGHPTYPFISALDRPPPIVSGVVGGTPVFVSGPDSGSSPSLADLGNADEETWRQLIEPREPGPQEEITVATGESVTLALRSTALGVSDSTVECTIVGKAGDRRLEINVDETSVSDHATFWSTDLDRRGGVSSIGGGVLGFALPEGPGADRVLLEIRSVDNDGFTLQTSGRVELTLID